MITRKRGRFVTKAKVRKLIRSEVVVCEQNRGSEGRGGRERKEKEKGR